MQKISDGTASKASTKVNSTYHADKDWKPNWVECKGYILDWENWEESAKTGEEAMHWISLAVAKLDGTFQGFIDLKRTEEAAKAKICHTKLCIFVKTETTRWESRKL